MCGTVSAIECMWDREASGMILSQKVCTLSAEVGDDFVGVVETV